MKQSLIRRSHVVDMNPVVFTYLSSLDCPRSLACWILFSSGEHDQLAELDCSPNDYTDAISFQKAYYATKFLSKFDGLKTSFDTHQRALLSFHAAEQQCAETNVRLNAGILPNGSAGHIIDMAREKIFRLLANVRSEVIDEILDNCRFGPGVTTTHKGSWLSPYEKLDHKGQVTTVLGRVLSRAISETDYPNWSGIHSPAFTFGNTVLTVPKNSKTKRTIAVEPVVNAFFQRGVGEYLKKRLIKWGVTLNDQSKNQRLARLGSLNKTLATVDLKAASDTISIECVRLLLPESWVRLLEALRSPCYELNGSWHRYHKHSSMGNGYTFELESLIFSSIVKSICAYYDDRKCDWAVYGDDIVIPVKYLTVFNEVIEYLGFSLNPNKTFTSGEFRESCGSDWYNGVQCTPFYFKRKDDIVQQITLANWLRSSAPQYMPIRKLWLYLYNQVPKNAALKGPADSQGLCFHVNQNEYDPFSVILKRRPYGPILGYKLKTLNFEPDKRPVHDMPRSLAGSLYSLDKRFPRKSWLLPIAPYDRVSVARAKGRWLIQSYIYSNDIWPNLRGLA